MAFLGVQEASLLHLEVPEAQEAQEVHQEGQDICQEDRDIHQEDRDIHQGNRGNYPEVLVVWEVLAAQGDQGMGQEYYRNAIPMIVLGDQEAQHDAGDVPLSFRCEGRQVEAFPQWQEVEPYGRNGDSDGRARSHKEPGVVEGGVCCRALCPSFRGHSGVWEAFQDHSYAPEWCSEWVWQTTKVQ